VLAVVHSPTNPSSPCSYLPGHRSEWAVNHHRDSIASHIGHTDQLAYFAAAENAAVGRVRYAMLEKMIAPCGPPPTKPGAAAAAAPQH
jgi:hypothetical protein